MLFIAIIMGIGFIHAQDFDLCALGDRQSPINIVNPDDAKYYRLELRFKEDVLIGEHDDTGYQIEDALFRLLGHDAQGLMVGYKPYEFRVAAPAQHQVEGQEFDLELEIWMDLLIIYKNPYQRAALSIFFKIVDDVPDNAIFTQNENQEISSLNMIEMARQLSHFKKYVTYRGSDTIEPCIEDVNRFLINKPLNISQTQYDYLTSGVINMEVKPLQEYHRRQVIKGTLIVDDQTSANYQPLHRYLSLAFIFFLFLLIFALFIKEQRQKNEIARKQKENA